MFNGGKRGRLFGRACTAALVATLVVSLAYGLDLRHTLIALAGPDAGSDSANVVAEGGGTVKADGVSVKVPAGALTGSTRIAINRMSGARQFRGVPPLLVFSVDARHDDKALDEFAKAVEIEVSLDTLELGDTKPSSLGLAIKAADGDWRVLDTRSGGGTLAASVDRPGEFAVVLTDEVQLSVEHHFFANISVLKVKYQDVDKNLEKAQLFDLFRIRFRLQNNQATPTAIKPLLEYRAAGSDFNPVGEKSKPGVPFLLSREWVSAPKHGTKEGPLRQEIPVKDFLVRVPEGTDTVVGQRSMGVNPAPAFELEPGAVTEQEFTVRVASDALRDISYQFRLTNDGQKLDGDNVATVQLGDPKPVKLSPGQRRGQPVKNHKRAAPHRRTVLPVRPRHAVSTSATKYAVHTSATTQVGSVGKSSAVAAAGPRYKLSTAMTSSGHRQISARSGTGGSPHTPSTGTGLSVLTTDGCAACHRAHTAQSSYLLKTAGSQSTLCFLCHDGTGSTLDTQSDYTDPSIPANDGVNREYYSHDALNASSHTGARDPEFAGVSNRHSACADCHDPHSATAVNASHATPGAPWLASGRTSGISGVSVTNGGAGSSPGYTFLRDGVTLEYQLCFKCHSGYTQLLSNGSVQPSQYELDKGVEFNPNNASYHPIEAAGTNATTTMTNNLAGTSPYKLWNFTAASTVRCLNCHGSDNILTPPADSSLPVHTSTNRGILIKNYRDRILKSVGNSYDAADFALCYVCHSERPYADPSGAAAPDTDFRVHGFHLNSISGFGSGGNSIDVAGDGRGNAICAECHFRLHSSNFKVGTQVIDGSRLVNFAPDVQGVDGNPPRWDRSAPGGTCSLKCHGFSHRGYTY